jgi:hypothetical protein
MPLPTKRVFVSYSHDSRGHNDRVLELSDRLRAEGVDCRIDQYEESPPEGWPRWCFKQDEEADFVLVVCTETYARRFDGKEEPGRGAGVAFEGFVITQSFYGDQSKNVKYIPVVFSSDNFVHIPKLLAAFTIYDLSKPEHYERLYRRLTDQPFVTKPGLGEVATMPRRRTPPLEVEVVPMLPRRHNFARGRAEKRHEVKLGVQLSSAQDRTSEGVELTFIQNVSKHGARVVSRRNWEPGEIVEVTSLEKESRLRAEVVYCARVSKHEFQVGLVFESPQSLWFGSFGKTSTS